MRQLALGMAAILTLAAAGWLLYDYGQWRYIYARMNASAEQREIWSASRATELENVSMRDRMAVLERGAEVDREAYREMQGLVGQLQDEILSLKEEVEFYRKILNAGDSDRGLSIQGLHVRPTAITDRYQFQLVLTRLVKDDSLAKGFVDVSIEGQRAGHNITLPLVAITLEKSDNLSFEFKNFRRIEGTFAFPSGFQPVRVRVVLTEHKRERPSAIQTFEWGKLVERVGGQT